MGDRDVWTEWFLLVSRFHYAWEEYLGELRESRLHPTYRLMDRLDAALQAQRLLERYQRWHADRLPVQVGAKILPQPSEEATVC